MFFSFCDNENTSFRVLCTYTYVRSHGLRYVLINILKHRYVYIVGSIGGRSEKFGSNSLDQNSLGKKNRLQIVPLFLPPKDVVAFCDSLLSSDSDLVDPQVQPQLPSRLPGRSFACVACEPSQRGGSDGSPPLSPCPSMLAPPSLFSQGVRQ